MLTAFIITFILCLIIGVPVAIVLGLSSLVALVVWGDVSPLFIIPQRTFRAMNSFPLMAIPFFMLAGALMGKSIINKLIEFANSIIGFLRGGLAYITVVVCMFFGGITGAGVAETTAIGSILIPAMIKEGYKKEFSTAVTASSSIMGPIIPPSIPLVVYALTVGSVSIGALFLAGVIPGILIGFSIMMVILYNSRIKNLPKHKEKFVFKDFLKAFKGASWALLLPLIILGGILTGLYTATEASVIAVVYALFVNFVIYRDMTIKELVDCLVNSAVVTSVVLFMIGTASVASWIITVLDVPQMLVSLVSGFSSSSTIFLILTMIVLLIAGCLLESSANIILFAPILAPVAAAFGVDPIHFGFIFVMNLMIGMITPPVGIILFVACGITNLKFERLVIAIAPFLLVIILVLLLVVFVPEVALFLPRLFGLLN